MARRQTKVSGLHPEEIKARFRMTGVSMEQVSLQHDKSPGYLRAALRRPLYEAEQIIARIIGTPAHKLWPERYSAKGEPLHHGRANSRKGKTHLRLVSSR